MAELVDALDSKSGYRKVVQVRFLFWALKTKNHLFIGGFFVNYLQGLTGHLYDLSDRIWCLILSLTFIHTFDGRVS